jgi:exodeoxyribonuclease VII large subunit
MERRGHRLRSGLSRCDHALEMQPGRIAVRIERCRERTAALGARAVAAADLRIERRRRQLLASERLLASLSYKSVLSRGFALVRDAGERPVHVAAALGPGEPVSIEFADGRVEAVTRGPVRAPPQPSGAGKPVKQPAQKATPASPSRQGSLF